MMALGVVILSLAAIAMEQPRQVSQPAGDGSEIRMGWPVRSLPFALNLDRRAAPPRSLRELVDRIYLALPQDRLDMFAAYYGGNDFERLRARYDSTISFFRDLYTIEILHQASRIWGFDGGHFPLDRARRCAGSDFVTQVAIQIGTRRLYEAGSRGVLAPLRDTAGAYGVADRISRQLFATCDRRYPPTSIAR